jgi:outer membrane receptor protein involved in Fe transport
VRNFISVNPSVEVYDGITYTISRPTTTRAERSRAPKWAISSSSISCPARCRAWGSRRTTLTWTARRPLRSSADHAAPGPVEAHLQPGGDVRKIRRLGRVAYNWRSTYFDSTYLFNGVGQPSFRRGYGWLAASLSYDVTPNVTISLEGNNLTRVIRRSYYNNMDTRPHETQIDDRQIIFGVRFKL